MEKNYTELARQARLKVLEMIHHAGTSHIASNFSVIDIAAVLYENLHQGDQVVWSKGWAAATVYYYLAKEGKIPTEDLDKFGKEIDGHIPYLGLAETSTPGVLVSGGAMGHGLPVALGMAIGKKRAQEAGKMYCIMSDGEMNEGTTWESAMLAHHHKLDNLVVFIDANKWQAMGKTNEVLDVEPIENRWKGFGWHALRVDGHNTKEIEKAVLAKKTAPTVIICDTVKGKGVSFFENHLLYHYKHVEKDEYQRAKKELEAA